MAIFVMYIEELNTCPTREETGTQKIATKTKAG